jgi:low-affinity ferrous iron transport protein
MYNVVRNVCVPVCKREIQGVAPTHMVAQNGGGEKEGAQKKTTIQFTEVEIRGFSTKAKARRLDRWLDLIVSASGSEYVFFTILTGLIIWAFLGIPFHDDLTWPALISDIQAILSYIFDSLLMRQQTNGYEDLLTGAAELRSRTITHNRTLRKLTAGMEKDELAKHVATTEKEGPTNTECALELPRESWFGQLVTAFSHFLGHIVTIIIYWICVFVWLGFGPSNQWSNMWQLDINSSTSALMVLVFSFLANIRERHSDYTKRCLDALFRVDAALELKLRCLTDDQVDNEVVVILPPKANTIQKAIFYYADVVGTLVGIVILILVLVAWVAVGPVMKFSDNWWLFIGTYAGLVGMNDGFVLRNVQSKLREYEDVQFQLVDQEDAALFRIVSMGLPDRKKLDTVASNNVSLTRRVSLAMGKICAHEITVVAGFVVLLGLLTGSSLMKWSTTGQLLCNVPPSIIESFFMIILITGHNYADEEKREVLQNLYQRRLTLLSLVNLVRAAKSDPNPESVDIVN